MSELTADAKIQSDGNPHQPLTAENFTDAGDIKGVPGDPKGLSADLALVRHCTSGERFSATKTVNEICCFKISSD